MNVENSHSLEWQDSSDTTSARQQLLGSLGDEEYRHLFVEERVKSSMALQIRALREQRVLSQKALGEEIGMAQTWISKLENPEYGKMTVATLLRLANAFDTDLEIKFRPFSVTIDVLPRQDVDYFTVPSFDEEFGEAGVAGASEVAALIAKSVGEQRASADSPNPQDQSATEIQVVSKVIPIDARLRPQLISPVYGTPIRHEETASTVDAVAEQRITAHG